MIVLIALVCGLVAAARAEPEAAYQYQAPQQRLPEPPRSSYLPGPYISPSPGPSYAPPSNYLAPSPTSYPDSYASRAPIIQKHVYVHVAPEEPPQLLSPTISAPQSPPRKHYKLVFIKAPNPPSVASSTVQLPQRDEEKTLIYVLSKKPGDSGSINIATPPPTPPAKPEVYFIRYKSQEDQSPSLGAPLYGAPPSPGTRYGAPYPSDNSIVSPSASSGPY